MATNIKRVNQF